MRRFLARTLVLSSAFTPFAALALNADFDLQPNPDQADFRSVAEDLSAVFNHKSLAPAEPGGITGFAVGAYASYVATDDSGAWDRLLGDDLDEIGAVGLIAQKGLPFGVDLGASYVMLPGTDATLFGAELRYALLEGSIATPAVGLRGSYSKLNGVDDLESDSYGLDLSVSKGFGPLTPYAGVGYQWSRFEADPQFNLDEENVDEARFFVGLRLSALIGITPEYERIGDRQAFNLRFGVAF